MTQTLFEAIKDSWSLKVMLANRYIKDAEMMNSPDLDGVIDQIWAEEMICKET